MSRFLVRRLLVTIPVLLGIVFVVFAIARIIPGDPCRAVLGERATDAVCNDFIHRYGLDQPIPVQFGLYLQQLASGDLGTSIKHSRPITTLLVERLPTTLELAFWAMVFATIVGIPLGLISAVRRNSPVDAGTMVFANLGVSMPVFVLGLLLAYLFALVLKDTPFALPPSGRLSSGVDVVPLVVVWGLTDLQGPPRAILDFVSGIYTFSALITGQWGAWADCVPPPHPAGHRPRHDSRSRSSRASPARACSRSWASTTCGRRGRRDSPSGRSSSGTRRATRSCPW